MIKSAIWGFYRWGNFGDDLMALEISKELLKYGPVSVFELRPQLAEAHGVATTADVDKLVAEADIVVLGGGNLLATRDSLPTWRSTWADKLHHFVDALTKYKKPLLIVSVGGDGQATAENLLDGVADLLAYDGLLGISVRLPSDIAILRELGVTKAYWFPDILCHSVQRIAGTPAQSVERRGKLLGVHLPATLMAHALTIGLACACRFVPFNLSRIRVFNGFPEQCGDYVPYGRDNSPVTHCEDPYVFVAALSECDTILSHKSHVGLVAAMCHARFISIGAHPKVKAQLQELGLTRNVLSLRFTRRGRYAMLVAALAICVPVWLLILFGRRLTKQQIDDLASQGKGHFELLHSCIERVQS